MLYQDLTSMHDIIGVRHVVPNTCSITRLMCVFVSATVTLIGALMRRYLDVPAISQVVGHGLCIARSKNSTAIL